ncbi:MAG: Na+/H+ antiporter NhaA [Gemmatimonadaceae bacterium]|nr:Na+/H+ antiporter NhaA [Gemmatimonadaceae bacterium]
MEVPPQTGQHTGQNTEPKFADPQFADPIDDGFIDEKAPPPTQALSGLLLLGCAVVALLWANSPWREQYHALNHQPIAGMSLQHFINDALMTLFFLVVGLEIKRELLVGALSSVRKAALPIVGAIGGMLLPAAIYAVLARGTDASPGWGVPMATDIAFALGIVALLGDRVPAGLRIFLAALAIADDLGAVLVIALFYTPGIALSALALIAVCMAALYLLNRFGVQRVWPYVIGGLVLWYAVYRSGVHASIAGVLLAVTVPSVGAHSVQERLEHALGGVVTWLVVPLFALANAGVSLPDDIGAFARQPAVAASALGLIIGKPFGIFAAAWIAVRLKWADLPDDSDWVRVFGVATLGGIGFTMSLFIAALAFGESAQLDAAKIGVLTGSFTAGIFGALLLSRAGRPGAATMTTAGGRG